MTPRILKIINEMANNIMDNDSIYWCVIRNGMIYHCRPMEDAPTTVN